MTMTKNILTMTKNILTMTFNFLTILLATFWQFSRFSDSILVDIQATMLTAFWVLLCLKSDNNFDDTVTILWRHCDNSLTTLWQFFDDTVPIASSTFLQYITYTTTWQFLTTMLQFFDDILTITLSTLWQFFDDNVTIL
jgi:hypothetical protein